MSIDLLHYFALALILHAQVWKWKHYELIKDMQWFLPPNGFVMRRVAMDHNESKWGKIALNQRLSKVCLHHFHGLGLFIDLHLLDLARKSDAFAPVWVNVFQIQNWNWHSWKNNEAFIFNSSIFLIECNNVIWLIVDFPEGRLAFVPERTCARALSAVLPKQSEGIKARGPKGIQKWSKLSRNTWCYMPQSVHHQMSGKRNDWQNVTIKLIWLEICFSRKLRSQ